MKKKNNIINMNKKAISAVVSIALLLVVTVAAVVAFQVWYQSFQSGLFVEVEREGSISTGIETIVGNTLYIRTRDNLTVISVSIDGVDCNVNGTYSGMSGLDVSDCVGSITSSTPEILVVTNEGVMTKTVYVSNVGSGENIQIPGNTSNKLFNLATDLYWTKNLSFIGQHQWATANTGRPEPIWNESTRTYDWASGLNESHYPAFRACINLELDGYSDWRLPTRQEWLDLGSNINWGQTNFENYRFTNFQNLFWSGNQSSASAAFRVHLSTGASNYGAKTNDAYYVACVRRN